MYIYTKLNELKENNKFHIYGLIKFIKINYRSITIGIFDDTINEEDKLICNLFFKDSMPHPEFEVGKILRIHRLKIEQYNGKLIGIGYIGFSYVLFNEIISDDFLPTCTSSPNFKITNLDVEIIKSMRIWISRNKLAIEKSYDTLDNCTPGKYFDLLCQIVAKCQLNDPLIIYVWDGTPCNLASSIKNIHITTQESLNMEEDKSLTSSLSAKYIVPLIIYDEHINECTKIKVGKYILVRNLHVSSIKSSVPSNSHAEQEKQIEFILHGGHKFNRGIEELSPNLDSIKKLCRLQEKVLQEIRINRSDLLTTPHFTSPVPCERIDVLSTLASPHNTLVHLDCDQCQCSNFVQKMSQELNRSHGCLNMQVVKIKVLTSVLIRANQPLNSQNPQNSFLTLGSLKISPPDTYQVCANLYDYSTRCGDVLTFLNVWCPTCNFLSKCPRKTLPLATPPNLVLWDGSSDTSTSSSYLSSPSPPRIGQSRVLRNRKIVVKRRQPRKKINYSPRLNEDQSLDKGSSRSVNENWIFSALPVNVIHDVGHFNCPRCRANETSTPLEFVYALKLGLAGCDGQAIEAILWKEHGETFFQGIKPIELLRDPTTFHSIRCNLESLCCLEESFQKSSKNPKCPLQIPIVHCEIQVVSWTTSQNECHRDYFIVNTIMNE